jgi:PAS domain S-box-containing protein
MTIHASDSPKSAVAPRPPRPRRPGRRAAEAEFLATIVDSSEDAIFSKTLEGVITTWNKAAERIYGYRAAEIIGQSVSLLMPPDRPHEMVDILDRLRLGEAVGPYETTRRRKDGATVTISLTVSPMHDAAGEIVGASSIGRDITEREREREQARLASQYARSLIEASLDPLVTISAEGKITDVNEATIRVTGVERRHLVGTDFSDYFTEPDRAREGYRQVFAQGFITDYPLTIHHVSGGMTDVLYNASVYKDVHGNVLGVFAAARDITAQRRAEGEVARQRARELERLAELERFQKLTVGRELRMIELKQEIEDLRAAAVVNDG